MDKESPQPVSIKLHQKSRILEISFSDGQNFDLSCELLRVYSPSAEVRGHGPGQSVLQTGKENVSIEKVEPVGHYAVKLIFNDGHNTGLYSWAYLYNLGENKDELWKDYLQGLEDAGYQRQEIPD
ncbi:MAG: gamma-butyrobetaine hydroxylase-like domain-containing protein [Gammaproteobacteria bacterium]|nr:MAG: DUF971 domain-containing protein [Gammaproteobacteria bacterium]